MARFTTAAAALSIASFFSAAGAEAVERPNPAYCKAELKKGLATMLGVELSNYARPSNEARQLAEVIGSLDRNDSRVSPMTERAFKGFSEMACMRLGLVPPECVPYAVQTFKALRSVSPN